MTITISNLTINNNVPGGTTIGTLIAQDASGAIIPCNYILTKASIGYFAIVGDKLITAWSKLATPGYYSLRIRAVGSSTRFSGSARFTVNIVTAAPPPPASILVNGSNNAVVAEGAALAVKVANGPGNTTDWVGLAAAGAPETAYIAWVYLNGTQTPPVMGLTSATVMMTAPTTDGRYEARFYLNNAWTVSARTSFAVVAPPPPPPPPPP